MGRRNQELTSDKFSLASISNHKSCSNLCHFVFNYSHVHISKHLFNQHLVKIFYEVGTLSLCGEHGVRRTIWYLTEFTVWLEKLTSKTIIVVQSNELLNTVNPVKMDLMGNGCEGWLFRKAT